MECSLILVAVRPRVWLIGGRERERERESEKDGSSLILSFNPFSSAVYGGPVGKDGLDLSGHLADSRWNSIKQQLVSLRLGGKLPLASRAPVARPVLPNLIQFVVRKWSHGCNRLQLAITNVRGACVCVCVCES